MGGQLEPHQVQQNPSSHPHLPGTALSANISWCAKTKFLKNVFRSSGAGQWCRESLYGSAAAFQLGFWVTASQQCWQCVPCVSHSGSLVWGSLSWLYTPPGWHLQSSAVWHRAWTSITNLLLDRNSPWKCYNHVCRQCAWLWSQAPKLKDFEACCQLCVSSLQGMVNLWSG